MDNISRFTKGAQTSLTRAAEAAQQMGHNYVGTEHMLLGLLMEGGTAAEILSRNVDVSALTEKITRVGGRGSSMGMQYMLSYTPRSKKVLELAVALSRQLEHKYVGTEHILLALIQEREGMAFRLLYESGADLNRIVEEIKAIGGSEQAQGGSAGGATPELDKFSADLTEKAKNGELDPVIGRQKEIERIIQILSRRTKNNPVLIGEPGVGKSAIAEGLAQRIVDGNIPELLKNKRVVSLDLAGMVAGAKYRGEFEERLKGALNELKKNKNVILFIDEVHTIVGAGSAEGSMDAANILKPLLARGEIQVIGATTIDEYRKNIEKDAALERRFQPVMVGEPTKEESLEILKGLRDRYEAHHKVQITDEALKAAVELSSRYIMDRFLPDKAIDLIDEAASKVRISMFTAPPDMRELEDKLSAIAKEKEEAVAHEEYEQAGKLKQEEAEIKKKMDELKSSWQTEISEKKGVVTEENIADIVSDWTGVPVRKLTEDESERLLHLEEKLHERVIGQDEAVSSVARAIRRARAGLKDPNRPVGSFIFLGPTGVGKTELTKALAEAMFGDENAMIRLDMSEYMEKHAVSKLIGSPPGYVGYEEGGQLTQAVRTKPYSVVLFDEIEKAHPDVFNTLLQVLEDGRLTDSKGRTVDFKNTVIIMTSNVGASQLAANKIGFDVDKKDLKGYEDMKESMMNALKETFRPEFLNRIDDIIVFTKLTEDDTKKIAELMLGSVAKRLADRDIDISWNADVIDLMAKEGISDTYGARPLRRMIQQTVEDKLSEEILEGKIAFGDRVEMTVEDGKVVFSKAEKAEKKEPETEEKVVENAAND
ncbi:MAG: ATP-dependent Clp protease ATP-binding subunit [Christensenellaceae bacterium]|nr:ATP-dependent Clp protease ATP-binding subunit [Christensenellaceae bacterium]